jgi:long-subunit fatty acid transport protein
MAVDVGYAHLFVDETKINNSESAPPGATLTGSYDSSVDILSVGLVWDF